MCIIVIYFYYILMFKDIYVPRKFLSQTFITYVMYMFVTFKCKGKKGCRGTCVTFEKNTSIDYILGLSSL